jgi:hypothetical protein
MDTLFTPGARHPKLVDRRSVESKKITDVRTLLLAVPLAKPVDMPFGQWRRRVNLIVIVETSVACMIEDRAPLCR